MLLKYSTVFFDWSGVVADDSGDEFIALSLQGIGATNAQIRKIMKKEFSQFMLGQISEDEYWNKLKNNYKLRVDDSRVGYFSNWRGLTANERIIELVCELKSKGVGVGLISNIIYPVHDIIMQSGYYSIFDEAILSCKVGLLKPQKEIYQLALKRMNTVSTRSIFIDDKQSNLDTAADMGFRVLLAKNPDQIINDVHNLIGIT
jgi:putative hydrolase of the HAD superfamily